MSTNRVVVVESVADELTTELEAIAQGMENDSINLREMKADGVWTVGDVAGLGRMNLASQVGADKMHEYVDDAVSKVCHPRPTLTTLRSDDGM